MNSLPWSVSIGAVDRELRPQFYSSQRGQCYPLIPTVVCPTYGMLPWARGFRDFGEQGGGTSSCAPMVSGALAILSSAFPKARNAELRAALRAGAMPLNPDRPYRYFDPGTGSGLLQVENSLARVTTAREHPTYGYELAFPTTVL